MTCGARLGISPRDSVIGEAIMRIKCTQNKKGKIKRWTKLLAEASHREPELAGHSKGGRVVTNTACLRLRLKRCKNNVATR